MTSKSKNWFLNDEIVNVQEAKPLYRFIPFDVLLQMINEKTNVLVQITKWEDVYENFMLKESFMRNGRKVPLGILAERFYGQCWTTKRSSDAMWRIYSPDRKSVRIKTQIGKLYDTIPQEDEDGTYLLGKVEYYPQSKIEGDLRTIPKMTKDQLSRIMLESLFVKRNSFSHESECRLVFMKGRGLNGKDEPVKRMTIDPLDFIENVYFDPRADSAYVERCKKVLIDAFGYPSKRIKKSNLYSFTPLRFELE